ncbi:hypothetical protein BCR33DRAFT_712595 [Rhizoclosmatium globosum]|uniref:TLC domain-containing protein n=1 Tax=Rhizoclosmatium globosum TaxID=329046 RepID=A0A1Y2CXJ8_9FUNG|nr:hypothetical protein BCR33DRAFT_712595 [Rhizoclosmatium globosum]|eukprot:ORY51564.1 hypothetical protein BCR33DRAFT_712595 [Rhizoclosmatium globosum]
MTVDSQLLLPFAGFTALHFATANALIKAGIPPSKVHIIAEKLPSTVNALTVSTLGLWVLFVKKNYQHSWITAEYPKLLDTIFAIHGGFTAYDLIVMLSSKETSHISSWLHHVFGIAGVVATRALKKGAYYPACFMPTEVTVVSSNLLYLVQKFSPDSHELITAIMVFRCILFTVFRLPAGPWCLYHAINTVPLVENGEKETKKEDSVFNRVKKRLTAFVHHFSELPLIVKAGVICNVSLFAGLNTYWTFLTYRALWRQLALSKRKKLTSAGNIHHI